MPSQLVTIRRLGPKEAEGLLELNAVFGEAFDDAETYGSKSPSAEYLSGLLKREHVIVLAAVLDGVIVGGLVAYELDKLEQARREIYIYDLAVRLSHRRRGIATGLIEHLRAIAIEREVYAIFVQADYGDDPAIALYGKLGAREDVLHFDILTRA